MILEKSKNLRTLFTTIFAVYVSLSLSRRNIKLTFSILENVLMNSKGCKGNPCHLKLLTKGYISLQVIHYPLMSVKKAALDVNLFRILYSLLQSWKPALVISHIHILVKKNSEFHAFEDLKLSNFH